MSYRTVVLALLAAGACEDASTSQPIRPPPCFAEKIAAGGSTTWALKADGTLWQWGERNWSTVDGRPPPDVRARPVPSPPIGIADIAMRSRQSCVLFDGGKLRCNDLASAGIDGIASVAMGLHVSDNGGFRNCALTTDGTLLHFALTSPSDAAADTSFGADIASVGCGYFQTCVVKTDGSLWCAGMGFLGDGQGRHDDVAPPAVVLLPLPAVSVAVGWQYSCAVLSDGSAACWGQGDLSPYAIDIRNIRTLVAGWNHVCALTTDGSVACWGANGRGQLGFPPRGFNEFEPAPHGIAELGNDVTAIAAGEYHTCARRSDGTIWCWGQGTSGQIGNNVVFNPPTALYGCE